MPRMQPSGKSRASGGTVGFPEGFWTDEWTEQRRALWVEKLIADALRKRKEKP